MPTYSGNAFEILSQVRYGINEYSTALVQGTDTTGAFLNAELMQKINTAQNYLWGLLFAQFPEYFLTSGSLAFTASLATLPGDCWKIKDIRDSNGYKINPIPVSERHVTDDTGSAHLYYRYGNTIRLDQDDVSDTGTIWYYKRCRELDTGLTSAGGALSATLATTSKAVADYYNGMSIENVTDSNVDVISDYSAARVCTTTTQTWAASKYYGIVSELPEVMQPLIAEYTILQLKKDPRVPVQITPSDVSLFNEILRGALQTFAGSFNGDTMIDDLINDFEPMN
jgi:hypothetical protein